MSLAVKKNKFDLIWLSEHHNLIELLKFQTMYLLVKKIANKNEINKA
jgi:hypothetical protein